MREECGFPVAPEDCISFDGAGMHDGTVKGDHSLSAEKIHHILPEKSSVTRPPDATEMVAVTHNKGSRLIGFPVVMSTHSQSLDQESMTRVRLGGTSLHNAQFWHCLGILLKRLPGGPDWELQSRDH